MRLIKVNDDFSDKGLAPYLHLKAKNKEPGNEQCFIVETHTVIQNAIEAGCVPRSFLVAEKHIYGRDRELLARFPEATVYTAEDSILEKLTGFELTRGILACMTRPQKLFSEEQLDTVSKIIVLENVLDASNIGSILRSACGLGIDAVLLDASCCDPLHRKAIRTSMGGVFKVPWLQLKKPGAAIAEELNSRGFQTLAFALDFDAVPLQRSIANVKKPFALFFGNEGKGLDACTVRQCKEKVIIPMQNAFDSLNVSVAVSIALWECSKIE